MAGVETEEAAVVEEVLIAQAYQLPFLVTLIRSSKQAAQLMPPVTVPVVQMALDRY